MATKIKEAPVHCDRLDNPLSIGDYVAFPQNNSLAIGTVVKMNPVMVKVLQIGRSSGTNKYPQDLVLVNQAHVTMYILKHRG